MPKIIIIIRTIKKGLIKLENYFDDWWNYNKCLYQIFKLKNNNYYLVNITLDTIHFREGQCYLKCRKYLDWCVDYNDIIIDKNFEKGIH